MSKPIFQLPDTTIQFGDEFGNIAHQGILGSNINLTTPLTSTFPTTSTGDSLGHYHYTEPTTNALKFLNVAGTGSGGHKFYTANSTTAPVNTASIGLDGITIDKSVQGGATLVNLPSIIVGQPTQVVFSFPPALDTFGIQYGVYDNPIQVLFNSGSFTTGTTYYARATNAQTLEIRTTTTPSDPPLDCSSFTFGQVAFAYVSGNTPSTIQTININDDLTITTGTKSCSLSATLLRNNTIKTTLDMDNNTLQFVDALGTTITTMASNNYQINNEPEGVSLGLANNRFFITNQSTTTTTNIYTGQVQQTNLTAGTQTVLDTVSLDVNLLNTNQKSSLTSSTLTIRDLNNNVSILTPTDLTFNGVSLPSTVSTNTTNIGTNTTNIATNTTDIATNTTNITKNTNSISKLQYANPINMANSPVIYGTLPSSPPMIPTTNAINSGFNGWYYRNISSAYNNISWSVGFQPSNYVVSNLKGIYFTFVSLTTTSKPFFSVYTLPATAPNFYNSRRSYVPAIAPATITAGIPYIYYYMFDNAYPTPFKYCHQAVPLTLSGVNPVGAFGANELLYFASINTNSISPANTEELIVAEAGVIIDDGTGTLIQPFSFNSASVFSPNSYKAQQQGLGTITPTISNNGTTYIATANFTISNAGLSGVPAGFFIIVQGTTVDRIITYNTSATKTVYTNSGTTNAGQVIFYWLGDTFVAYN
jgi:hypothetical protein